MLHSDINCPKDNEILMTVGKSAVNVGEFKYIYEKITETKQIIPKKLERISGFVY